MYSRFLLLNSLLRVKCNKCDFSLYQSVAELEQKWQNEVDDAMHGKLENNVPFFYDYHFNEVSTGAAVGACSSLCSLRPVHPSPSLCLEQDEGAGASVFNERSFF